MHTGRRWRGRGTEQAERQMQSDEPRTAPPPPQPAPWALVRALNRDMQGHGDRGGKGWEAARHSPRSPSGEIQQSTASDQTDSQTLLVMGVCHTVHTPLQTTLSGIADLLGPCVIHLGPLFLGLLSGHRGSPQTPWLPTPAPASGTHKNTEACSHGVTELGFRSFTLVQCCPVAYVLQTK